MHFIHHTKVNDDMEFHYYKKIKKSKLLKRLGFATKWVKQHGLFNNSPVISHICYF